MRDTFSKTAEQYPYVKARMPISDSPELLRASLTLRFSKSLENQISELIIALYEDVYARHQEAWDRIAQSFGYSDMIALQLAGKNVEVDWACREVILRSKTKDDEASE